ncbi:SubName: Full=Uncharacterized protein {ECO:0000313/EMBL:CCA73934.1} [Serendipita indica DSM 11827]|nr:SubName: Full=Uncharacterized protein {ECO:0000313/EMBL:CCA73934.1} [Serendipita indica DSM 11827]
MSFLSSGDGFSRTDMTPTRITRAKVVHDNFSTQKHHNSDEERLEGMQIHRERSTPRNRPIVGIPLCSYISMAFTGDEKMLSISQTHSFFMVKTLVLAGALSAFISGAAAQTAGQWGQCGGNGYTGPTQCPSGWVCTAVSPPWYYQCLQGTATSTSSTRQSSSSSSTRQSSSSSSTRQSSSSSTRESVTTTYPSSTVPSSTSTGATTGGTLLPGNSFIRGVEAPFFHLYLQSETVGTASDAVLGSPSTAAQFQIISGQLVQNPTGSKLYAQVAQPVSGDKKLKVTWSTSPATFGTFSWSGDTLLWSDPSVTRSQNNAWLICPDANGNDDLYVNLGPYAYNTPAGCGDQTIHAYTGSTATA